jgi:hypothetical protein
MDGPTEWEEEAILDVLNCLFAIYKQIYVYFQWSRIITRRILAEHKADCKLRVAELRDEALFKDPPAKEDCPTSYRCRQD